MKKLLAIGLILVIALTVVLSVAACGSDDTTETTVPAEETTVAPVDTESTEAPVETEAPVAEDVTTTVAQ